MQYLNPCISIIKRELMSYFSTTIAYLFLIISLILFGVLTFYIGRFYERGQADLEVFFFFHPWVYLILIPAVSMRIWAEEHKHGTIELIMTLAIPSWVFVVGKFIASWLFVLLALVLTFPMWITVNYLGSPDNSVIFTSYLGSFLMSGSLLAMGSAISASTKNQIIALILAMIISFFTILISTPDIWDFFSYQEDNFILNNWMVSSIMSIGILPHYQNFSRGLIVLNDVIYFLSFIIFSLVANIVLLNTKKPA